jgi:serine phosphatase RsbU (regulator of sigma subunit)
VPVGLVLVDFYEKELALMRSSVVNIAIVISVSAIVLVIVVLSILLELVVIRHIKLLDGGIKRMSNKQFETKIKIRTHDEFESLARGFNDMAKNLNLFYKDLDGIVKERTSTIMLQKEELQVQADNLLSTNELLNKQFELLLAQKEKIEQQHASLEIVNAEITKQKQVIEKTNNQIVSSINYAMRIQRALLHSQEAIDALFPQNFILYLPRDIVSGDFYYIKEVDDIVLIVAADCTGHGVPGAFMSMLGISFLNEIVENFKVDKTSLILEKLREKVKYSFGQTGNRKDTYDGMDMALVALDRKKGVLQFSGAYSQLWIARKPMDGLEQDDFIAIKGDPIPIGLHPKDYQLFTQHSIPISEGDTLYLFSDGYLSQFGGSHNETFKIKRFKELMQSIVQLPMDKQKEVLLKTLVDWRGNTEQTDDVLVVGLKI